jgi:hypothetical protein
MSGRKSPYFKTEITIEGGLRGELTRVNVKQHGQGLSSVTITASVAPVVAHTVGFNEESPVKDILGTDPVTFTITSPGMTRDMEDFLIQELWITCDTNDECVFTIEGSV